jgi:4'-phosphopantetheinyl transferase EntD
VPCATSSGLEPEQLRALVVGSCESGCVVGVALDDDAGLDFAARRKLRRSRATRDALDRLDASLDVPAVGDSGEPVWAGDVVGSISHSEACTVAVVARAAGWAGLGVDIELDVPVSSVFARRVCSKRELESLVEQGQNPENWALVVLSAKEAVHKLQFPYSKEVVGLRRVEIELRPDQRFVATFREELAPFERGFQLQGRFRRQHGLILTTASLTRSAASAQGLPTASAAPKKRFASEKAASHWQ